MRCKVCCEYPTLVLLHSQSTRLPPIATQDGTKFRTEIVKKHLTSIFHEECEKAYKQACFTAAQVLTETPIGRHVQKSNLLLYNHIGKLMIHTYGSAKKLTISANTFPSRVVIGHAAEKFDFNDFLFENLEHNFNYVTPSGFRDFLEIIVECHRPEFSRKLESSLGLSLRCDGSVDRVQVDKIYTMVKSISSTGSEELNFLGAAEPTERGAPGLLGAIKEGFNVTVGSSAATILKNMSSLVTDGASINTGDNNGLWKLLSDYLDELLSSYDNLAGIKLPLLKIWCSAHR